MFYGFSDGKFQYYYSIKKILNFLDEKFFYLVIYSKVHQPGKFNSLVDIPRFILKYFLFK